MNQYVTRQDFPLRCQLASRIYQKLITTIYWNKNLIADWTNLKKKKGASTRFLCERFAPELRQGKNYCNELSAHTLGIICDNLFTKVFFYSAGFKDLKDGVQQQITTPMEDERSASANWRLLNTKYRISREKAYTTNVYLYENLLQILQDNWEGQCTSGHSCKRKAQEELKELIRQVGGNKAVEELPIKPLVFLRRMQKNVKGSK